MTEFIKQLSTLALIIILLGFGAQTYRILYHKLCHIDQPQSAKVPSGEPVVRCSRSNGNNQASKENRYD